MGMRDGGRAGTSEIKRQRHVYIASWAENEAAREYEKGGLFEKKKKIDKEVFKKWLKSL